jgi:hypothetical protein
MEHWTRRLYYKDKSMVLRQIGRHPEVRRQRRTWSSVWEEFTHPCMLHPVQKDIYTAKLTIR